ncbi:hypothetical protein ABYF34_03560 [Buchananella felis]|uniref:hypothetical protein n=1 Tax=Buchananella felis TaxID=3231492 RepID=UPI0035283668
MSAPQFPGTEMVNPQEVFSGPGYNSPKRVTSTLALLSLATLLLSPLLALLVWLFVGWPPATLVVPALVIFLAYLARSDVARPGRGGAALTQFVWVMGWTSLAVLATGLLLANLDSF